MNINITISIESDNELISLWHRLDEAEKNVIESAQKNGYKYKYDNIHNGCHWAWNAVNDLIKERGLVDLL